LKLRRISFYVPWGLKKAEPTLIANRYFFIHDRIRQPPYRPLIH
jgi:hypothetical protein